MARGWESKSVEEQMASAIERPAPRPGESMMSEEARRLAAQKSATHERHKQSLSLQRENILSQRTSNPSRRAALAMALEQIETQLKALE
jgi:hypothetical protein